MKNKRNEPPKIVENISSLAFFLEQSCWKMWYRRLPILWNLFDYKGQINCLKNSNCIDGQRIVYETLKVLPNTYIYFMIVRTNHYPYHKNVYRNGNRLFKSLKVTKIGIVAIFRGIECTNEWDLRGKYPEISKVKISKE